MSVQCVSSFVYVCCEVYKVDCVLCLVCVCSIVRCLSVNYVLCSDMFECVLCLVCVCVHCVVMSLRVCCVCLGCVYRGLCVC